MKRCLIPIVINDMQVLKLSEILKLMYIFTKICEHNLFFWHNLKDEKHVKDEQEKQ